MITSNKWDRWQKQWSVDLDAGTARHQSGFTIRYRQGDKDDLPEYEAMITEFPDAVNRKAVFDPNWLARLIKQAHEMYSVSLRRQATPE
ncbi:MAG: hypothetical protein DSZ32_06195 [Gammaproteobacteria bacterium]|nr:MAG: hypothetical protein DSZ32_06195 [Gammaproteobacteria bacterium]